jgi:hypothetical protein
MSAGAKIDHRTPTGIQAPCDQHFQQLAARHPPRIGRRPHVSDDNPYSESQFKTLKYRPEFPDRFGSIEDARAFCQQFFPWYNQDHHHSGIALLTPDMLHYGMAGEIIEQRQKVLDQAYERNPERFTHARPKHPPQPTAVWINPPIQAIATEPNLH